jgi:hypothetical protein
MPPSVRGGSVPIAVGDTPHKHSYHGWSDVRPRGADQPNPISQPWQSPFVSVRSPSVVPLGRSICPVARVPSGLTDLQRSWNRRTRSCRRDRGRDLTGYPPPSRSPAARCSAGSSSGHSPRRRGPSQAPPNTFQGSRRAAACATMLASSPTPSSREDALVRRKWTPQKYSPGTIVLAPSTVIGKPMGSKAGSCTHRP